MPRGASWVLEVSPAELLREPALRAVAHALFPAERVEAFERRTGIDPYRLTRLVVGFYRTGIVAVGEGPWPASDVVRAQEVRLTGSTLRRPRVLDASAAGAASMAGTKSDAVSTPNDVSFALATEEAFGWHLDGYLGNDRVYVGEVAPQQFAVVTGSGALFAQLAQGITGSRASRAPQHTAGARDGPPSPASDGLGPGSGSAKHVGGAGVASLAGLRRTLRESPVRLYRAEPLGLGPDSGLGVVLARQRALSASVRPAGAGALEFELHLFGQFPPTAPENLKSAVDFLARQSVGRVLGIDAAVSTLKVEMSQAPPGAAPTSAGDARPEAFLSLSMVSASDAFVRGLALLFGVSPVAVP